jgi:hypothetical protein
MGREDDYHYPPATYDLRRLWRLPDRGPCTVYIRTDLARFLNARV